MSGHIMGIFVLCLLFGFTLACPCFQKSDKTKYCLADFVMKIKVTSRLLNVGDEDKPHFNAFYRIRQIHEPWRLLKSNAVLNWRRLYTGNNHALCGVLSLKKGTVYLVTGSIDTYSGKLRINDCSSVIKETPVGSYKRWKRKPPRCLKTVTPLWPATLYT